MSWPQMASVFHCTHHGPWWTCLTRRSKQPLFTLREKESAPLVTIGRGLYGGAERSLHTPEQTCRMGEAGERRTEKPKCVIKADKESLTHTNIRKEAVI